MFNSHNGRWLWCKIFNCLKLIFWWFKVARISFAFMYFKMRCDQRPGPAPILVSFKLAYLLNWRIRLVSAWAKIWFQTGYRWLATLLAAEASFCELYYSPNDLALSFETIIASLRKTIRHEKKILLLNQKSLPESRSFIFFRPSSLIFHSSIQYCADIFDEAFRNKYRILSVIHVCWIILFV